jgi:hypothetical protein
MGIGTGDKQNKDRVGGNIMSVAQYQRQVNTLDKEIADLEKKKAAKDKECANLQWKINAAQKRITKSTSAAMVSSKSRQISGWQNDYAKRSGESADVGNKISDKRNSRNNAYLNLQKAQQTEQKKQGKASKQVQSAYETRITELQHQITTSVVPVTTLNADAGLSDEYDVFVSHAFEDKESFVDEFVIEMKKIGFKVWYDTQRLQWGDSMRERIDNGLRKSRYGIVILSPNYIAEHKYWTKTELNALFQLETVNGKTILPVWHNLTKKQVVEYSPIIADRKAMTTAVMTAEEIALELKTIFPITELEEISNG